MKKDFLKVCMPCIKLVKAYLENHFGDPVTIPDRNELNKLACAQLVKDNSRWEGHFINYPETIQLALNEYTFRKDGFEISMANIGNFNNAVKDHIKVLCHTNLDSILSLYDMQRAWKEKFMEHYQERIGTELKPYRITQERRRLDKELADHEFTIKKAITYVVTITLGLDMELMPYETVKRSYLRYRDAKKEINI